MAVVEGGEDRVACSDILIGVRRPLPEPLAVVRRDDDDRVVELAALLEHPEEPRQGAVELQHLRVVAIAVLLDRAPWLEAEGLGVRTHDALVELSLHRPQRQLTVRLVRRGSCEGRRLRRRVRRVGIHRVQPEEERLLRIIRVGEPFEPDIEDPIRGPVEFVLRFREHVVVVAALITVVAVEERVPHDAARAVARPVERLTDRLVLREDRDVGKGLDLTGQQHAHRGQRPRRHGVGALEQRALPCHPRERRRRVAVVAVGRRAVGPQGIDRDEHHVGCRGPARRSACRAPAVRRRVRRIRTAERHER